MSYVLTMVRRAQLRTFSTVKKILTRIAMFWGKEHTVVWIALTGSNDNNPKDVNTTVPSSPPLVI